MATAAGEVARLPLTIARALAGAVRSPTALARQARDMLRGLGALATALRPAAPSSLSGPPSAPTVRLRARGSVADIATVRHALGGTFNDVALAAVTAGFRRLLLSRASCRPLTRYER